MKSNCLAVTFLLIAPTSTDAQTETRSDGMPFELGFSFNYQFFGGDVGLINLDAGPGIDAVVGYRTASVLGIRTRVRLSSHEQTLFVIGLPRSRELLLSVGVEPQFRSVFDRGIAAYLSPRIGYLVATAVTDAALDLGLGIGLDVALTRRLTLEIGGSASAALSRRFRVFRGTVTQWNRVLTVSIGLIWGGRVDVPANY
jgi:hypothetical protein